MISDTSHADPLDRLLEDAAPPVTAGNPSIAGELARMGEGARREAQGPRRRKRHIPRAVVMGLSAVIVLGGAGAAAATTMFTGWSPWAQKPEAAFTYTLPSGAICEYRLGQIEASDSDLTAAIRTYLGRVDIAETINVDAEIERLRSTELLVTRENGTQVRAEYGSPDYHSPDAEYDLAYAQAVTTVVVHELARKGYSDEFLVANALSWSGETQCVGARW